MYEESAMASCAVMVKPDIETTSPNNISECFPHRSHSIESEMASNPKDPDVTAFPILLMDK